MHIRLNNHKIKAFKSLGKKKKNHALEFKIQAMLNAYRCRIH
jgi:hypothetical protein